MVLISAQAVEAQVGFINPTRLLSHPNPNGHQFLCFVTNPNSGFYPYKYNPQTTSKKGKHTNQFSKPGKQTKNIVSQFTQLEAQDSNIHA